MTPVSALPGSGQRVSLRVLVVEDDEATREVLCDLLTCVGYSVRCARDGREALEQLRDGHFAAMVLDVRMPTMDGHELRRRQRLDPRCARLPVVVISADPGIDLQVLAPDRVLRKPFDVDALIEALRDVIAGAANASAAR
jgi:CheY-like chemotaxis protein